MNKIVRICLLCTLFPFHGIAREETLEERKQRITRKFLQESIEITQSDIGPLPEPTFEEQELMEPEILKKTPVNLNSFPAVSSPPPIIRKKAGNWLFDDIENEESTQENLLNQNTSKKIETTETKPEYWYKTEFTEKRTASPEQDYNKRRYNTYTGPDTSGKFIDPRFRKSFLSNDRRQEERYISSLPEKRTGIFGRQQEETRNAVSGSKLWNSSRNSGLSSVKGALKKELITPSFSHSVKKAGHSSVGFANRRESQSVQSRQSPYRQPHEATQQYSGIRAVAFNQEQFRRFEGYKQWKKQNRSFNPIKDNYVDELIKSNGR